MLLVRRLAAMRIEVAGGTLRSRGGPQIPGLSGLDSTASRGVLGGKMSGFFGARGLRRTKAETDIRGEPLEQRAGIARLGFMPFFGHQ